ncbi:acyl carrier protein [Pirellulales bacterium]|nr:acyl carrier protein [Pirellulales bacterium]
MASVSTLGTVGRSMSPCTLRICLIMERTQLSAIVLELLEKETGETYDALEDSTTLNEGLGLDSLDMAGLILHIESHFGVQIETELLENIKTVGQILDTLEEKIAVKEGRKAA